MHALEIYRMIKERLYPFNRIVTLQIDAKALYFNRRSTLSTSDTKGVEREGGERGTAGGQRMLFRSDKIVVVHVMTNTCVLTPIPASGVMAA